MSDNEYISEQYRVIAKEWVDLDAAATLLEETKSAFLSQRMTSLGDIAVTKAEKIVKATPEWTDYITKMVDTRKRANLKKVQLEYLKMKFWEQNSHEASKRAEMRL